MNLSLIVDNSKEFTQFSQVKKVLDFGYSSFTNTYKVWWINTSNHKGHFQFDSAAEMYDAIREIQSHIDNYNEAIKQITLAHSEPLTWLDLAKKRVAHGISADKRHSKDRNSSTLRNMDRK